MHYYFAPMEGITDTVFRDVHFSCFGGVERYYMPFFSPTQHRELTGRESRELPFADSRAFVAIPQVMTKCADDFLWAAEVCRQRGYLEVNLNLGCPSGTVVAKGKGCGMLRDLPALDVFLDTIFDRSPLPISIKTRLGLEDPGEFPALLEIFNRYPIAELTLHPRVRSQFYKGSVDMQMFDYALQRSKNPLCYNGNLNSIADIQEFSQAYPDVNAVMIGRGLLADPGFLQGGTEKSTLQNFTDALLARYSEIFGSRRNAMFRLKENWRFLLRKFDGSEKLGKRLMKTTDFSEFTATTAEIFATLPLLPQPRVDW